MPIQPTSKIWHNGNLIPWDKAQLHVMSHVIHYGSSVFEGIRCYGQPQGAAVFRLPEHIEIALYRIAQEGLQNIVKHANASVARLFFRVDGDTARLEIVDNGIGFDTFENPLGGDEMGGYGVLSMAERAELVGGRLNIRSRPGAGTAVTATIPVPSTID